MRGSRSLFADLIEQEAVDVQRQGRSADLIAKRNTLLVTRYEYYRRQKHLSYQFIIETLSNEFLLRNRTVTDIITGCYDLFVEVRKENPSVAELRRRYPHLVWY